MDGCNGRFQDYSGWMKSLKNDGSFVWMDVMAILRITMGGWMVSEMDGCNGRFRDYSGWMKSQKNKKIVVLLYLRWIDGE